MAMTGKRRAPESQDAHSNMSLMMSGKEVQVLAELDAAGSTGEAGESSAAGTGPGGTCGANEHAHGFSTGPHPLDASMQSSRAAVDSAYFDSYAHFDIHQEMLSDRERTNAYKCVSESHTCTFARPPAAQLAAHCML
jgi:hypothetical protein